MMCGSLYCEALTMLIDTDSTAGSSMSSQLLHGSMTLFPTLAPLAGTLAPKVLMVPSVVPLAPLLLTLALYLFVCLLFNAAILQLCDGILYIYSYQDQTIR